MTNYRSRFSVLAIAALALLSLTACVTAPQAAGWEVLGQRVVGDNPDRDVIRLGGDGPYVRVRLCVRRAPIRLNRFAVVFGNGGRQEIVVRRFFEEDGCTRPVALRGGARYIRRVVLNYEAIRDRDVRPIVVVQGFRP